MKNIEYDIPIFESKDVANLNLYSEKMATAIKAQIDKFGNPLAFQGIKESKNELDSISNPQKGDIYGVIETNKNYVWNGKEWIVYSDTIELDNYYNKKEIDTKLSEVEGNEVFIGNPAEASETAKIIVEEDDFVGSSTLSKAEVYVGAEEPITGEKVWFRKGKNYLDISKLKSHTSYGITLTPTDTGIKISGTATDTYMYGEKISIALKKGVEYTLSGKNAGNILKIVLLKQDASTIIMNVKTVNDEITFIPTEDVFYIQFVLEGITKSTAYDYEISNLQIEQGLKATTYEHYIEQKIFIRNSNGVYEEFIKKSEEVYSTEETKIGTWIDGKPLYRKVLSLTTPSTTNSTKIANFDKTFIIKNYYGNVFISASNQLLPINFYFTDVYKIATYVVNNSGEIYMKIGSEAYRYQQATLTIEYTKTTD